MSSLELDRRLADLAAPQTRRGVLVGAGSLALAASLSRLPLDLAYGSTPKHHRNPFTLGVASGDPHTDGIVLWTRLAPEPLQADGGMEPRPVEVRWEVAKDPRMRRVVRRGRTTAWPAFAHSVHVEVDGLDDGREYFYRFTTGDAASPVGLTRTAPKGRVNDLTFSFCTCQKWDDGFYPAYREIAREDHDFVIHLGDYTYEYGIANHFGPRMPNLPTVFTTETVSLERYRLQHALYKTDPHLQAAHRAHPFIVIWDDHEVFNDYTGDPPGSSVAPTATARSTSTCRCARSQSRAARTCRSTARSRGAIWPSSACSIRASTAATRHATGSVRPSVARTPSTTSSQCSARPKSSGC
jgi:alkaline phosphatase D